MAGNLTNRIIKVIADSRCVTEGVATAGKALDGLGAKVEQTSDRINRASSRAKFDPAIRDAQRKNNVIASLGAQRFAEEQRAADAIRRQLQTRSRIAASLGQQRFAEE